MESQNAHFEYPKSAIGRALFFLFTLGILRYLIFFVYYTFLIFSSPIKKPIPDEYSNGLGYFEDYFPKYFIEALFWEVGMFFNIYIDTVITFGSFALIAYVGYRYLRNRIFGRREIFISMTAGLIALYAFCGWSIVYYNIFPIDGQEADYFAAFKYAVRIFISFAVCFAWLYFIFKKVPFGEDTSWKAEISAKKFFADNAKFIRFKCRQIGAPKLILAVLVILVIFASRELYVK